MTSSDSTDGPLEPTRDARADPFTVLWNGVEELTARLDTSEAATEDALRTLGAAVDDLKDTLAQLLKKEREKDIDPRRWAARATSRDWDALIDWVDELTASYSLLGDYTIPPCWPAHPGVVEDLAGLHHAWRIAVINDELGKPTGSNNLTAWHDRWLWPCLSRMKAGHYRTTNCRDRHHPENALTQVTDRAAVLRATPASAADRGVEEQRNSRER